MDDIGELTFNSVPLGLERQRLSGPALEELVARRRGQQQLWPLEFARTVSRLGLRG